MDTLALLSNWGFSQNPFREPVAELERNASHYFVMPPYFSEIAGNPANLRSTFVFGHRGDGKSTLRIEAQKYLAASSTTKPITVDYSSFYEHTEETVKKLTTDVHLEKLLDLAVSVFLEEIEDNPSLLTRLNEAELARLQWYIFRFTPDVGWKETERRWVKALNAIPEDKGWKRTGGRAFRRFKSFLRHKRAGIERIQGGSSAAIDIARMVLVILAPDLPGAESLKQKNMFSLLEDLRDIICSAGFSGLVVLVDRVDETSLLNDRPDLTAQLLLPIVLAAPLLEMPNVAIKLFMPAAVLDQLGSKLRTDRVKTFRITWSDLTLQDVLSRRLKAFSLGKLSSLDPFIEESIRKEFYLKILYYSGSNPRNMLRIIDSILTELCNICEMPTKITGEALDSGLRKFIAIRTGELDANEYIRRLGERPEVPPFGSLRL